MRQDQIEEMLREYRPKKARYAYLRTQIDMLERFLSKCEDSMVDDCVSMSQAITGMPHGTTVGDPTGRLAIDIVSGRVSSFVRQIREELEEVNKEAARLMEDLRVADILMSSMTDREREVVEMKIMAGMQWSEVLAEMNRKYSNSYSKRSLQRMYGRALEKAEDVVK